MTEGKKVFSLTLSDASYAALVNLADADGRRIAQMARVIIERYIKQAGSR
jgi:predicted DNA-binding protein